MKIGITIILVLASILWVGCKKNSGIEDQEYVRQINDWHQKRVERLTNETGWMSLAGLFWLEEGENTFGADSSNDIVFPDGKAPAFMGSLILKGGDITARILPNVDVLHNGKRVSDIEMTSDADGEPTLLSYGTLSWYVIKRSSENAIRLRDSANPNIKSFHGIERYPVDPSWRIEAIFERYNPQRSISVPTILGTMAEEPCPGALVFEIEGETYRLDVIGDLGDRQFFVIFGDPTNSDETYPAGRYVYVANPGSNNKTVIDFNKAYNPPCAFTEYATCPFPPEQNILSVKVRAGEKKYH